MNSEEGRDDARVIPPIIHSILARRGMSGADMDRFVFPDYDLGVHDPFLVTGMAAAVDRLVAARDAGELVVVYGDYDIDGITASAVMLEAMEANGISAVSYIPDRFEEGYGLNEEALAKLAGDGVGLVVTVDCGITSVHEAAWAREHGLDLIITDHHSVPEVLPEAVAVINPKQPGDEYPFKDLAGVGVAFKLACALALRTGLPKPGQEKWWLDLVALGTVCDVVPLVGENRILASFGLRVLRQTRRAGLVALTHLAGVRPGDLSAYHLGYVLGPRMNAAGRLDHADRSLELVRTADAARGAVIAGELDGLNRQRRDAQDRIFEEAKVRAADFDGDPVLVMADAGWSHGVVGIVASKLVETLGKPVLIGQELGSAIKGSARSVPGFNMVEALRSQAELFDKFGGHFFAAGFTFPASNIDKLREGLCTYWTTTMDTQAADAASAAAAEVDAVIENLSDIDMELLEQLSLLEPHGSGNLRPRFALPRLVLGEVRPVGAGGKHLKLVLIDEAGEQIGGIAFGLSERYGDLKPGDSVTAVGELSQNEWQGVTTPQVIVRELHGESV